jgi:hypothetical protein
MLETLISDLDNAHVEVLLAQVRGPVRDKLRISGLMHQIGENHIYLSVNTGVQDFLSRHSTEKERA